MATVTPTRKTAQAEVDRWNAQMRASKPYQDFMRSIGNDGSGRVTLSREQQAAFEKHLAQNGIQIPSGMHIDQGGNLNQKNSLVKNVAKGAAIGGAVLTGAGAFGVGPMAGVFGGGATTAGGVGTVSGVVPGGVAPTVAGTAAGAGSVGAGTAAAGGSGVLGWLKNARDVAGGVGAGLGASAAADAHNRGAAFSGQLDLERLLMERDQRGFDRQLSAAQEGRTSATDAWDKLMAAQRLLNPAPLPNVSPYQAPQRQISDAERRGADALTAEVMARLTGGNPISAPAERPMSVDPSLLQPGKAEKAKGVVAPLLSYFGRPQTTR